MSNLLDEQTMYLRLDAVSADGLVADDSGNGVTATVKGGAPLGADDFFGQALEFDGISGRVECGVTGLGGALEGGSANFTVTGWIRPAALAAKASDRKVKNVFFARSSDAGGNLEIGVEENGSLQLYLNGDGGSSQVGLGAGELATADWHFVAVVFAAGQVTVCLDDTAYSQSVGTTKLGEAADVPVTVGATPRSGVYFNGGIHGVRVFRSALTDDQVRTIKSADLTDATAASHQSVLIDFMLEDPRGQPTLYILGDGQGETMTLTIQNQATTALSIPARPADSLNADTAPFLLRFRPGVLAASCQENLGVRSTDWSWRLEEASDDGSAVLLLAPKTAIELAPAGTIVLALENASAEPAGGARGSRAMLGYRGIGFPSTGDTTPATVSGYRQTFLNIVNQSGKRSTPLLLSFVGSNAILNDGASRNTFTLSLLNPTSAEVPLSTEPDAPTRIVFRLPVSDDPESVDAVCTEGQAAAVSIDDLDGGWEVEENALGLAHEWTLTNAGMASIPAQGHIEFEFSGLISSAASGRTSICMQYQNLPGYWDGHILVAIEKAPMLYLGTRVGIGVNAPAGTLHIRSSTAEADGLAVENDGAGNPQLAFHDGGAAKASFSLIKSWQSGGRAGLALHDGASEAIAVREGKVGIGNSSPRHPLSLGDGSVGFAADSAGTIKFLIEDTEAMRVGDASAGVAGKLGVGTLAPGADLHLKGTGGNILVDGATRPALQFEKSNTGQRWNIIAGCDSHLFFRNTFGDNSTDYSDSALTIRTDKSVQVPGALSAGSLKVSGAVSADSLKIGGSMGESSLGETGYQKMGSFIFQWGVATNNNDAAVYYPFPTRFPNACLLVLSGIKQASTRSAMQSDYWDKDQFRIDRHSDIDGTVTFAWFAVGH